MSDTDFYTVEQLGPKMSKTPEGFLFCRDVPVARIGVMEYGPNQTPIPAAPGMDRVYISRDADEVFSPISMRSIVGKPLVDEHPVDEVSPETYTALSKGFVINPRRGEGEESDLLICDFLICDAEMIEDVIDGKREVSCGYVADYTMESPGYGRQSNITYNHVAFVEAGRCGPRCAVGDEASLEGLEMPVSAKKKTFMDSLRVAFMTGDKAKFEKALIGDEGEEPGSESSGEGGVHIHNHMHGKPDAEADDDDEGGAVNASQVQQMIDASHAKLLVEMKAMLAGGAGAGSGDADETEAEKKERLEKEAKDAETEAEKKKIEDELEKEAPKGTGDRARRATDSAFLGDSFSETVSLAEAIAPGIKVPTFDNAKAPGDTYKTICQLRRSALMLGLNKADTHTLVNDAVGGGDIAKMTCDSLAPVFRAVGAACRDRNSSAHKDSVVGVGGLNGGARVIQTKDVKNPGDLNNLYATHYKTRA